MKNLAGLDSYKDVLNEHRQLLRQWVQRTGDKIAAEYVDAEVDKTKRLQLDM
jgi:hypothetical protein